MKIDGILDNQSLIIIALAFIIIFLLFVIFLLKRSKFKQEKNLKKQQGIEIISSADQIENIENKEEIHIIPEPLADVGADVAAHMMEEEDLEPIQSWFERLKNGLRRTHGQMIKSLDEFFISKKDKLTREEAFEHLFELLVQADVGVKTSEFLVNKLKNRINKEDFSNPEAIKLILKEEILILLNNTKTNPKGSLENPNYKPHVVLMVGVNGVGKTTSTGKLAFKANMRGQSVVIGAADTFRAAAVEQLAIWATRSNADMIRLKEASDPASVAFESSKKAKEKDASVCIIDTAGRLHSRQDLMQELAKISRVLAKDSPEAPHEVLLVLDATTGQNALQQARIFREVATVTGIILTKLDGSAKGGIVIAIAAEMGIPIRYVGVGESVEDLEIFNPEEFVKALFTE